MNKKAYFFIDDVIWTLRDLTREKPASLFDNPFMKMLKTAHDRYGLKVQLNVFYRTDFYYGDDEFTLAEVTDKYKAEWEASSDWLKLGFHSKQEFPDYPYVNADYQTVKNNFDAIYGEIKRFACDKTFARAVVPHWLPISKEGCQALYDNGIKIMGVSAGEKMPYDGDVNALPYGHAFRLLQNRKPETGLFTRKSLNKAITSSICSYNHLNPEEHAATRTNLTAKKDEIGIYMKQICNSAVLNLSTLEGLPEELSAYLENEFIGYATHEQYFYPEYFAYQPDYAEKLYLAASILSDNGYEYIFAEDLV